MFVIPKPLEIDGSGEAADRFRLAETAQPNVFCRGQSGQATAEP